MTAIITFLMPLILVAICLLVLASLQQSPGLSPWAQAPYDQLLTVLTTLGSGDPWQGALTIAITASLVGLLFDTYTLYLSQGLITVKRRH